MRTYFDTSSGLLVGTAHGVRLCSLSCDVGRKNVTHRTILLKWKEIHFPLSGQNLLYTGIKGFSNHSSSIGMLRPGEWISSILCFDIYFVAFRKVLSNSIPWTCFLILSTSFFTLLPHSSVGVEANNNNKSNVAVCLTTKNKTFNLEEVDTVECISHPKIDEM